MTKIKHAYLIVTNKCNLRCPFCFRNKAQYESEGILPLELFGKLSELGIRSLSITGGEPFLNTKLPLLLDAIKSYDFFIEISTNGFLCNRYIIDYLKFDVLSISMDSLFVQKLFNYRERSYEKIYKILKNKISCSVPIQLYYIFLNLRQEEIEKVLEIQNLGIMPVFLPISLTPKILKKIKLGHNQYTNFLRQDIELLHKYRILTQNMLDRLNKFLLCIEKPECFKEGDVCRIVTDSIVIDMKGTVYPCFYQNPIGSLWNTENLNTNRTNFLRTSGNCSMLSANCALLYF
ncbi:MAG: radical SAM protein [Candidatus Methanoperedens sp.]|nr:radical SAM protein [Candidatus Methanoperedens sp.]MCZ7403860.1 radical SAM protein [Candidatus Methanoperedens sp.]